jgi:AraC-like DNA-binding protein
MHSMLHAQSGKTGWCALNNVSTPVGEFRISSWEVIRKQQAFSPQVPDRARSYEIIWIRKGAGLLTVDMQTTCISENAIYCVAPGQYRQLQMEGSGDGYYLALSTTYLHLTESQIDFSFFVELSRGDWSLPVIHADADIGDLIVRINHEFQGQHFMRSEVLKGLIKVLIIYLSRRVESSHGGRELLNDADLGFVRKFMQLLRKSFASKKLVADYADELCITPNYLNYLVKKHTGFPASHHIQQYIIMEAKRRAAYSGLRMKEIADALGFEDHAHFSKFFKNYSGMNFSSFRKGMLSNP